MDREYLPPELRGQTEENVMLGVLGAFLGSLAGVLCIVLLSQLNYVAAVSGAVMAVCALRGYEKFAGTLSKKGAVISGVIILVMTYGAHHTDIAFELMKTFDMSFGEAFVEIPSLLSIGYLDGGVFWGNLALLYLFTLLGAVPIIHSIANSTKTVYTGARTVQAGGAGYAQGTRDTQNTQSAQTEIFTPDISLTRPQRVVSYAAAAGLLLAGFVMLFVGGLRVSVMLVFGGFGAFFSALFLWIAALTVTQGAAFVYARADGVLWRVNLPQLNSDSSYHFTDSLVPMLGVRWYRLKPDEQERARDSIERAIETMTRGGQEIVGAVTGMNAALQPLAEPRVEKETKWNWKISYTPDGVKRRKTTIQKTYPGLAPTPDTQPAGAALPLRPRGLCMALLCIALCCLFGFAVDADQASGTHTREPDTSASGSVSSADPYSVSDSASGQTSDGGDAEEDMTIPITDENYQQLFHLAEELDYKYIGIAYLPVPAETFGEGMFVDAHIPYCDAPVYSEDGVAVTGTAHGMRVTVTVTPTDGDARDVVNEAYDAFVAAGADIYEEGVGETQFSEEYSVAAKQVLHFEENGTLPRLTIFYSDSPVQGHCYTAQITYLLEQTDDDYAALLAELSDAYGLTLPEIDPYE